MPGLPYRLIESVGSCRAGTVWSAVDEQDRPATVALLDGAIANDPGIRESFAAATAAFGQLRRGGLFADLRTATPWAACLSDGGPGAECVFLTMGLDYQPRQASPEAAAPVSPWAPGPPPAKPAEPAPAPEQTAEIPAQPQTVALWSTGPEPVSPAPRPAPGPPPDPFTSAQPRIVPSPPRRRRTGLWIGVGAAVVVLLGAGGTALALQGNDTKALPQQQPHAVGSISLRPAPSQSPPTHPGLEPPAAGGWPTQWPKFKDTDGLRTYAHLDGLDFVVKVPPSWQCIPGDRALGYVRYYCGAPSGKDPEVGGEVVVRDCPNGCSSQQQHAMRTAEEAWGLQWVRGGAFSCWAESSSLQTGDATRYGLVVVGYFRSSSANSTLDHEIVIRMQAPVDQAGQIRRVVSYLRDELTLGS